MKPITKASCKWMSTFRFFGIGPLGNSIFYSLYCLQKYHTTLTTSPSCRPVKGLHVHRTTPELFLVREMSWGGGAINARATFVGRLPWTGDWNRCFILLIFILICLLPILILHAYKTCFASLCSFFHYLLSFSAFLFYSLLPTLPTSRIISR